MCSCSVFSTWKCFSVANWSCENSSCETEVNSHEINCHEIKDQFAMKSTHFLCCNFGHLTKYFDFEILFLIQDQNILFGAWSCGRLCSVHVTSTVSPTNVALPLRAPSLVKYFKTLYLNKLDFRLIYVFSSTWKNWFGYVANWSCERWSHDKLNVYGWFLTSSPSVIV